MSKFQNLQLEAVRCFGYTEPKAKCWLNLIKDNPNKAVAKSDKSAFEQSLKEDVAVSYQNLAAFIIKDLDTDTRYITQFNNEKKAWDVGIFQSPNAEVDVKDKIDFFRTYLMKKLVAKADDIFDKALDQVDFIRLEMLERGALLHVDEVKYEAIVDDYLVNQTLRKNFKDRTFVK